MIFEEKYRVFENLNISKTLQKSFSFFKEINQLRIAFDFMEENPMVILHIFILAITQATAQFFIFFTIKEFGPLIFIIIISSKTIPQGKIWKVFRNK